MRENRQVTPRRDRIPGPLEPSEDNAGIGTIPPPRKRNAIWHGKQMATCQTQVRDHQQVLAPLKEDSPSIGWMFSWTSRQLPRITAGLGGLIFSSGGSVLSGVEMTTDQQTDADQTSAEQQQ